MSEMARSSKKQGLDPIVIDRDKGLEFATEEDLYSHFENEIRALEAEYLKLRSTDDVPENRLSDYDHQLERTLDDPDEVWEDEKTLGEPVHIYIRYFESTGVTHVATCYVTDEIASFVYLHFPTKDDKLVEEYRRGELLFERGRRGAAEGAIEGDALFEGDELAMGLYQAMLRLRIDKDIVESEFSAFAEAREITLEDADEIWRSSDSTGNVLVSFIKEFNEEEDFFYVVVTLEDTPSGSHALLFSFPTRDRGLVGRYRHGENLQADEVIQESSH